MTASPEPATGPTLKACPFCGSSNVDPKGWSSKDSDGPACDDCGGSNGSPLQTHAENIAAWNRRASPEAATVGRIAEIIQKHVEPKCSFNTATLRTSLWLEGESQAASEIAALLPAAGVPEVFRKLFNAWCADEDSVLAQDIFEASGFCEWFMPEGADHDDLEQLRLRTTAAPSPPSSGQAAAEEA